LLPYNKRKKNILGALMIVFLIMSGSLSFCQTPADVGNLYQQHDYTAALAGARQMISNQTDVAFANSTIGRILVDERSYDSSIPYLQTAIMLDGDRSYISGWSYAYLGEAHVIIGERQKGIDELNKAIALHATDNSVSYARHILGALPLEPHWMVVEGKNITYYFQDSSLNTDAVNHFINEHEAAYEKINKVFQATLPRKMVFYVWYDADLAKKILHMDLGFTDPETCTTNTLVTQSVGHEMTHTIAYWGWGRKSDTITRFINEGVAVAFDQNPNIKYLQAQKAVENSPYHSVLDIWEDKNAKSEILYPVGGAFLTFIYAESTPRQFERLIKCQTIDNAEKIYGKENFDKMISEFNDWIGLK